MNLFSCDKHFRQNYNKQFYPVFCGCCFLMLFLLTGCLLKNSHTLTEIIEMNVCGNVCRDDIFIYSNDDDRKLVRFTFHSVIETLNSIKHIHKYTRTDTLSNTDRRLKWQNTWITLDKIKKNKIYILLSDFESNFITDKKIIFNGRTSFLEQFRMTIFVL